MNFDPNDMQRRMEEAQRKATEMLAKTDLTPGERAFVEEVAREEAVRPDLAAWTATVGSPPLNLKLRR